MREWKKWKGKNHFIGIMMTRWSGMERNGTHEYIISNQLEDHSRIKTCMCVWPSQMPCPSPQTHARPRHSNTSPILTSCTQSSACIQLLKQSAQPVKFPIKALSQPAARLSWRPPQRSQPHHTLSHHNLLCWQQYPLTPALQSLTVILSSQKCTIDRVILMRILHSPMTGKIMSKVKRP